MFLFVVPTLGYKGSSVEYLMSCVTIALSVERWIISINRMCQAVQNCNIVMQYCNIDRLIALANCNRREQIAIFTCWQFVERSRPNVNAKRMIGLFCTSSQSGFIYKLASESYYELLNFAVDSLILLLYVKIAICLHLLQFARAITPISGSILQYCVTILHCCPQRNTGFDCNLFWKLFGPPSSTSESN